MNKNKVFVPGEIIAVEEEFVAGKNTFEEHGYVKAAGFGIAEFDNVNKEVSITCKNISNLTENDIVFGKVMLVKDAVVVIEIIKSEEDRVLTVKKGQIPIKLVSNNYVTNLKKLFKIGDILKARVVSANDLAVDLTTQGEGYGVTIAYCSQCRHEMKKSDDKLVCFNCGSIEERKWFEDKDIRKENDRFDSRRTNDFNRGPRNDFNRDTRNNFNRDSRNDFNREPRNNFSREPRNNFNNDSRNNFNNRKFNDDFKTRDFRGE
ncbi:MAG: exosome complex RNA-binding protein Csl4 [Candidatus ainarchaeum sp.]|nr:exosome complex RNA-binding protein Csl4 [Candidatus ainarchaeum sp.]